MRRAHGYGRDRNRADTPCRSLAVRSQQNVVRIEISVVHAVRMKRRDRSRRSDAIRLLPGTLPVIASASVSQAGKYSVIRSAAIGQSPARITGGDRAPAPASPERCSFASRRHSRNERVRRAPTTGNDRSRISLSQPPRDGSDATPNGPSAAGDETRPHPALRPPHRSACRLRPSGRVRKGVVWLTDSRCVV